MSSITRNHTFSLQPKASRIINELEDGKKSKFVSDGIVFFHYNQGLEHSEDDSGKVASASEITQDEAKKMPRMGGLKAILARIFRFHL